MERRDVIEREERGLGMSKAEKARTESAGNVTVVLGSQWQ